MPDENSLTAYLKLRRRHQLFVDAMVSEGVGTKAIVAIGFKGRRPEIAASKLMARPEIRAAIEEARPRRSRPSA